MLISSAFVLKSLGSTVLESNVKNDILFSHIETDTRKLTPGDLFVALKGDNFDGNMFIDAAFKAGATGAIVDSPDVFAKFSQQNLILVSSTLLAFRQIAGAWREQFKIPVIAVGGSVGKTTTKDMITASLKGKFSDNEIIFTHGSQNGDVGIPTTLLKISSLTKVAVIEVGIDEVGRMEQHTMLVKPSVALLTAISEEHLEFLKNIENVAREERILLSKTHSLDGDILVNIDDLNIALELISNRCQSFSIQNSGADIYGSVLDNSISVLKNGVAFGKFPLLLPGKHHALNQIAAISAAIWVGLKFEEILSGLSKFQNSGGRTEIKSLPNEIVAICDYYNANPASMLAAFEVAKEMMRNKSGSLHLCLGDMLELGNNEEAFHRSLAAKIPYKSKVYLLGQRMKWLEDEMIQAHPSSNVKWFDSSENLTQELAKNLQPYDTLLIKGSRGLKMESIWNALATSI